MFLSTLTDDKRFNILTLKHGERSAARNKGINVATGDYIHFVDDDDLVDSEYLMSFVKVRLHETQELIIRCGMELFWPTGQRKKTANYNVKKYRSPSHYLIKEMCGVGCLSIPTRLLRQNKFDIRFPHWQDTHLFLRLVQQCAFYQINDYLYFYRQHDKMGTQRIFNHPDYAAERLDLTLQAMQDVEQILGPNGPLKIDDWSINYAQKYLNYAIAFAHKGSPQGMYYLKKALRRSMHPSLWPLYARVPFKYLQRILQAS